MYVVGHAFWWSWSWEIFHIITWAYKLVQSGFKDIPSKIMNKVNFVSINGGFACRRSCEIELGKKCRDN